MPHSYDSIRHRRWQPTHPAESTHHNGACCPCSVTVQGDGPFHIIEGLFVHGWATDGAVTHDRVTAEGGPAGSEVAACRQADSSALHCLRQQMEQMHHASRQVALNAYACQEEVQLV
jgi:hypothetical protein